MSVPPEDIPQNHTIPTSEKVIPQTDVESEREPTLCLMIDNYDSFTFNLYQYFCQLGAEMMVKRNDEITIPEVEVSPQDGCGDPGASCRKVVDGLIRCRFTGNVQGQTAAIHRDLSRAWTSADRFGDL